MSEKAITIRITPGTIFFIFLVVLLGWFLYEVRHLIPVILSAVIFSLALAPSRRFLEGFKIPTPIAVILLYILMFIILSLFVYLFLPIILKQYSVFVESLPSIIDHVRNLIAGTPFEEILLDAFDAETTSNSEALVANAKELFSVAGTGLSALFGFFGNVINVILFLLLTFLFSVRPSMLDNVLFAFTSPRYRSYVEDLWSRSKIKLGQWFKGQIILVFVIWALTYVALALAGVPNAFLLGAFAGVMELFPIFGPIIAAIPAVLMALTVGDFGLVVVVILIFVIIQQLENHLIYPLVVSNVVGVSSVLIILAVVVGASLAGFVGVIIAVPLAGVLQELFNDIHSGNLSRQVRDSSNQPPSVA